VNEVIYAKAGLFQLGLLAVVALIAFGLRSRLTFLLGGLGTQLGLAIPRPRIYANYSSVEGAVMGVINDSVEHLEFWAFVGASLGVILARALRLRMMTRNRADRAFS